MNHQVYQVHYYFKINLKISQINLQLILRYNNPQIILKINNKILKKKSKINYLNLNKENQMISNLKKLMKNLMK